MQPKVFSIIKVLFFAFILEYSDLRVTLSSILQRRERWLTFIAKYFVCKGKSNLVSSQQWCTGAPIRDPRSGSRSDFPGSGSDLDPIFTPLDRIGTDRQIWPFFQIQSDPNHIRIFQWKPKKIDKNSVFSDKKFIQMSLFNCNKLPSYMYTYSMQCTDGFCSNMVGSKWICSV